jgi:hypothetical protein
VADSLAQQAQLGASVTEGVTVAAAFAGTGTLNAAVTESVTLSDSYEDTVDSPPSGGTGGDWPIRQRRRRLH